MATMSLSLSTMNKNQEISKTDEATEERLNQLMAKIRCKAGNLKSWVDTTKSVRMAMSDKRHQSEVVDKTALLKHLDTLQKALKVTSQPVMVEKLSSLSRSLGLKFTSGPSALDVFISSDMFYVEVKMDPRGRVTTVNIAHHGEPQSCPDVAKVLADGKFEKFAAHLEGLTGVYKVSGDKKQKTRAFMALQSLEGDLNTLSGLQSSISGVSNYIHKSPLGIVQPRVGGLPMKLVYFVSPYDLLNPKTKSSYPLTVEAILENDLGHSVTIEIEASNPHKLQSSPLMTVTKTIDGKSLPSFSNLNSQNSGMLNARFVLNLQKPIPISVSTLEKIRAICNIEMDINAKPSPLLQLIADCKSSSDFVYDKKKGLFVTFRDQQHCYYLNGNVENDDLLAVVVDKIPFTHPTNVPQLLMCLRQQLLFNSLLESFIRPKAKQDLDKSIVFDVIPASMQHLTINFENPINNSMATVEIDLTDFPNLQCEMHSSSEDNGGVSDEYISKVFQRCVSIPVTLRAMFIKIQAQISGPSHVAAMSMPTPPTPKITDQKFTQEHLAQLLNGTRDTIPHETSMETDNIPGLPETPTIPAAQAASLLQSVQGSFDYDPYAYDGGPPRPEFLDSIKAEKVARNPMLASLLDQGSDAANSQDHISLSNFMSEVTPMPPKSKRGRKRKVTTELRSPGINRSPKRKASEDDFNRESFDLDPGDVFDPNLAMAVPGTPRSFAPSTPSISALSTPDAFVESHISRLSSSLDNIIKQESKNVTAAPPGELAALLTEPTEPTASKKSTEGGTAKIIDDVRPGGIGKNLENIISTFSQSSFDGVKMEPAGFESLFKSDLSEESSSARPSLLRQEAIDENKDDSCDSKSSSGNRTPSIGETKKFERSNSSDNSSSKREKSEKERSKTEKREKEEKKRKSESLSDALDLSVGKDTKMVIKKEPKDPDLERSLPMNLSSSSTGNTSIIITAKASPTVSSSPRESSKDESKPKKEKSKKDKYGESSKRKKDSSKKDKSSKKRKTEDSHKSSYSIKDSPKSEHKLPTTIKITKSGGTMQSQISTSTKSSTSASPSKSKPEKQVSPLQLKVQTSKNSSHGSGKVVKKYSSSTDSKLMKTATIKLKPLSIPKSATSSTFTVSSSKSVTSSWSSGSKTSISNSGVSKSTSSPKLPITKPLTPVSKSNSMSSLKSTSPSNSSSFKQSSNKSGLGKSPSFKTSGSSKSPSSYKPTTKLPPKPLGAISKSPSMPIIPGGKPLKSGFTIPLKSNSKNASSNASSTASSSNTSSTPSRMTTPPTYTSSTSSPVTTPTTPTSGIPPGISPGSKSKSPVRPRKNSLNAVIDKLTFAKAQSVSPTLSSPNKSGARPDDRRDPSGKCDTPPLPQPPRGILKKDSSLDDKSRDSKGNIFSKLSAERSSTGSPVKKQDLKPNGPDRQKIPLLPLPTTGKKVDLNQKMGQPGSSVSRSPVKVLPPSNLGINQRSYQDDSKISPNRPKPPAEMLKTSPSFARSEFSKNKGDDSSKSDPKAKPKESESKKDYSDSSGKSTPTKDGDEGSKAEVFRAPTPKLSKTDNKDSKKDDKKEKQSPKSPKSSPSSPEDNLVIDCQAAPRIIATSPVNRDSPPVIASPKVGTPSSKSPVPSPKEKKQASITPVPSPCDIDDDLMDAALMGPSSD